MTPHKTVTLTVDGQQIQVPAGRTVAAALMLEADQTAWRNPRFAEARRGLFCGIGVCFDCLVRIDGQPAMRACLVQACDDMVVQTHVMDTAAEPATPTERPVGSGAHEEASIDER